MLFVKYYCQPPRQMKALINILVSRTCIVLLRLGWCIEVVEGGGGVLSYLCFLCTTKTEERERFMTAKKMLAVIIKK